MTNFIAPSGSGETIGWECCVMARRSNGSQHARTCARYYREPAAPLDFKATPQPLAHGGVITAPPAVVGETVTDSLVPRDHVARHFDAQESARRRDAGMKAAAEKRKPVLDEVRAAMVELARKRVTACADADDAQAWLIANGHGESALGNAAGSVFKGGDWEFYESANSGRKAAHARRVIVWRLKQ